jgi:hypothetical protein
MRWAVASALAALMRCSFPARSSSRSRAARVPIIDLARETGPDFALDLVDFRESAPLNLGEVVRYEAGDRIGQSAILGAL